MRTTLASLASSVAFSTALVSAADASSCPSGQYQVAGTSACKPCYRDYYAVCTSGRPTGATKCATGYYLAGGRCMPAAKIPPGYYGAANGTLIGCGPGVSSCDESHGVTACKTGYTLVNGHCTLGTAAPSCPTNGICSNGKLVSCTNSTYASNGVCVSSCPSGSLAYYRGYCVAGSTCPADSFFQTAETREYSPNLPASADNTCHNCAHSGTLSAAVCMTDYPGPIDHCTDGYTYSPDPYGCFKSCPAGQFPGGSNGDCIKCTDPLAATCFADSGKASSCIAPYFFDQASQSCLNGCPAGQFVGSIGNINITRQTCDASNTRCYCYDCGSTGFNDHHNGWKSATCADYTGYALTCKEGFTLQGTICA
ncbi:hypothetical protein JCM8097_001362 [Rhodosporidiobolus ruineniae]